jgi:hypothetical protein
MSGPRTRYAGQAMVDALLVALLVVLALGIGRSSAVHAVVAALAEQHARFTWAISLP